MKRPRTIVPMQADVYVQRTSFLLTVLEVLDVPTTMTIYGLQLLIPPLPVPSSLQAITKTRRKRIKTNYLGCNAQSAGRLVNTQSIEASVDSLCREIITLCRHAIYVTSHTIQHI